MRIAILSDIHGSLAALDAVIADIQSQRPDLVLHGGDLVLNGPRPAEVVDRLRELGWQGVLGNTDEILWKPEGQHELQERFPTRADLIRVMFEDFAPLVREMLGEDRIDWLRGLPMEWRNEHLALVHASPEDLWSAPRADAGSDELTRTFERLETEIAVYCHIHRPFVRNVIALTVANSGSVGLSWDGDWRASYLLITDGHISVRRIQYELDRDLADLAACGIPHIGWLGEMRRIGKYISPPAER